MEEDKLVVKVVADTSNLKTGMQGAVNTVNAAKGSIKPSLEEIDKAISSASAAFLHAQKNAEIYKSAVQRLAEQQKSGAISAQQYKGSVAELAKEFGVATQKAGAFSSSIRFAAGIIGIGSVTVAVAGMTKKVIDSSREMQSLNARVEAIAGSSQSAAETMNFLQSMAYRQNISLTTLVDTYGRLKPSVDSGRLSMSEMRELMSLTNDAMAKFGLTTSQQQAALYGLSQVLGSATVTMEDLRQLTDQLPGSFSRLEKAMGIASGGLKDVIAKGETTSKEILPALIKVMKESEGAAESMGNTLSATFQDFSTAATMAASKFGEQSGIVSSLTFNIRLLTQAMNEYTGSLAHLSKEDLQARLRETGMQLVKQQEVVNRLAESYKNANAFEKGFIAPDRDRAIEKLGELNKAYDQIRNTLSPVKKETENVVNSNVGLSKSIAALNAKYSQAADNYKKSSQQLALEQIQKYKSTEDWKNLTKATDDASRASVKNTNSTEEQLKKFVALEAAQKSGSAATRESTKAGEEQNAMLDTRNKYLADEEKRRDNVAKAIERIREKEEAEAKKAQEEFEAPFKHAAERMQDSFADAFANTLERGKFSFKELADSGRSIMLRMVAEVAAAMIFKPMIQPVLAQAMGGLPSVGGIGGIGAISSALNSFGAKNLGLSNVGGGFVGPMQPGMRAGTTLSGLLGGAGMGLGIGGMNLFGGNQMGSTIGGGVGGLAGSFFGPLGSLAGSAIGSGLGSLFGPGKAVSAAEFAGSIGANDNLSGLSYGSKNGDVTQARSLSDALGATISELIANGVDIANVTLRGAINSKSGNRFEVLGKSIGFDPQDTESVAAAVAKVAVELAKAGNNSGSLGVALQHMQTEGRKAEEIIADLNFAAGFDKLGEAPKKISETEQAIKDLQDRFKEMRTTTERLGLDMAKLNAAEASLFKNIRDEFNKAVTGDVLQATNPKGLAVAQEYTRYMQQLDDAKKLGADINLVEQLHAAKLAEILGTQESIASIVDEQANAQKEQLSTLQEASKETERLRDLFTSISKKARDSLNAMNLANTSALSPEARYAEARRIMIDTQRRAMLGDTEAGQDLPGAINDFLEQSRNVNASNAQYKEDFALSQQALSDLTALADRQVVSLGAQVDKQQQQINLLQQISENTKGSTGGNNASLFSDASLTPVGKTAAALDQMTGQGVTMRQYHTLARISGYEGQFGAGGFDSFAKSNPQAAALFNQLLVSSGGTMRTFANGGQTPVGMPFIVGEAGAEVMQLNTPSTVTPMHKVASMGGDSTIVVKALMQGFSGMMDEQRITSAAVVQMSGRVRQLEGEIRTIASGGKK